MRKERLDREAIDQFKIDSQKYITAHKKFEIMNAIYAGILIGIGAGGWVTMGMNPRDAIVLTLFGSSFFFEVEILVLERQRYQEYVDGVIKDFGENNPS